MGESSIVDGVIGASTVTLKILPKYVHIVQKTQWLHKADTMRNLMTTWVIGAKKTCGVAFQNMMKYPVENQYCEFCSDLWDPFERTIPCVGVRVGKCTDIDYKIADNLIVVWDMSPSPYLIPAGQIRFSDNLVVDKPEWGGGQQRCKECPAGTYISKDRRKANFQQITVTITWKQCPKGMPSARMTDDIKLFIPQDVKDMTTEHSPNVVFPVADYGLFGCRACSKSDGVAINNVCTQCKRNTVTQQFDIMMMSFICSCRNKK